MMLFFGAVLLIVILMYNSLVSKKNEIENALGAVHTFLKKRTELIPNLVATVKQFASHESKLLTDLTNTRAEAQKSLIKGDIQAADAQVSQVLGRIVAVAEAYPELKSNENFLSLQASLNEIEEQLSAARRTYNAAVVQYNNAIEKVPTVIIASVLGYKRKQVFAVTAAEAAPVDVAKLFNSTGS